jgi:hypothetical protein
MTSTRLAAVSLVVVLTGCGTGTTPSPPETASPTTRAGHAASAGTGRVTVHVKDMSRRLGLG